jgi:hypothetical protein
MLIVLAVASIVAPQFVNHPSVMSSVELSPTSTALGRALGWLAGNQSSDGSYGAYFEHETAVAAYALWLNNSASSRAARAFSVISSELDNSSSWFWPPYGEADVAGVVFYAIAASHHLDLVNADSVSNRLLEFQQPDGGFKGYAPAPDYLSASSSVDTAFALWALANSSSVSSQSRMAAVGYLQGLQNSDGSFSLTRKAYSSNSTDTLGPEPLSVTAIVVLALKAAAYSASETHVSKALDFLTASISKNFTIASDRKGHVYGASLSALALAAFGRLSQADDAVTFVLSQQNSDGGFRDIGRGSSGSNALDTGWATIALEKVQSGPLFSPPLARIPFVRIIAAVGVVAGVAVIILYLVVRRRADRQTMVSEHSPSVSTH